MQQPTPRLVVIQFAVPQELAPAAKLFRATRVKEANRQFYKCRFRQTEVWLLNGGMGPRAAVRSADWAINQWKPDLYILSGVAGALSPGLQVGDVIVADPVIGDGGLILVPPYKLPVPEDHGGPLRVRSGPMLSRDRVLVTAAEKRSAYAHATYKPYPPPLAVEMEAAPVVKKLEDAGVRWAQVRGLSDSASDELPVDFNKLRDANGELPASKVAAYAMTHPGAIGGIMRLAKNTNLAAEHVARYLHDWLRSLA